MKTKTLFSLVTYAFLMVNPFTNYLFGQGTTTKTDLPDFEIKEIPLQKSIVIKADIPTKDIGKKMGELYTRLFDFAGKNKINPCGAPFAVYYAFDPQGNTSFEVGFPVVSKINSTDSIVYKEFPAMKVVSALYIGAYENMIPIYTQLQEYMTKNNLKPTGVSWEVYLTNPNEIKDPVENQTLIYFPIE